jgi:DNA-directed RNA polymerase subunit N (RpoN/RPB10)
MEQDIVDLPPVRCFTCAKVIREKYFEQLEQLQNKKLDTRTIFDKLLLVLEQVIYEKYSKSKSQKIEDVFDEIGLGELFENVPLKKRKYVRESIQDVIQQISSFVDDQISKKQSGSKILKNIGLDQILGDAYLQIKDLKYSPEDIMNQLGIKRPCCRTTLIFTPKMGLPKTLGPVLGYDIEPEAEQSKVEEVVEEEVPKTSKDRAKSMREKLQALKSKESVKPKEKRILKYLAV